MSLYPAQILLSPPQKVNSLAVVPGSKSITNRSLLIAALADGISVLQAPLLSDDTTHMVSCLRLLGVRIECSNPAAWRVHGVRGEFMAPTEPLFVGNSGTTIRFLTAAAALAPPGSEVVLDGIPRMRERPISHLLDALAQMRVATNSLGVPGYPPVQISGGGIKGGFCAVPGDVSSQYISALLMTAPYSRDGVRLFIVGEPVSKPYILITTAMMASFGVRVSAVDDRTFDLPGGQYYQARQYAIEPDASNAGYFFAAAAITGETISVEGLGDQSIQGDIALLDVLERMGCAVERSSSAFIVAGPRSLKPIDIDLSAIPDMAQTIAVVAAFAQGPSLISGLKTLRHKETDRVAAVACELRKLGVLVEEGSDFWRIEPPPTYAAAAIDTYDDHRMAMSFALAGLRIPGVVINDPGCVSKTFPLFWEQWESNFPGAIETIEGQLTHA